jgi:hypothetical protein
MSLSYLGWVREEMTTTLVIPNLSLIGRDLPIFVC